MKALKQCATLVSEVRKANNYHQPSPILIT